MNYILLSILLIASVSLIVSVPDSFAQVEKGINYDEEIIKTNPNGSKEIRWTSHFERINVNDRYLDYHFTETANNLILETARGSVSLDKNSCSFNFHTKGFIADNPIPLFSDSIVAFNSIVDLYSWQPVTQINGATCEAYYDQGNTSLVAKRYASGVGFMEYKYIFNNGLWKTQLEATNLTTLENRVFAFDQTIDLNRDTIKYGGNTKNLDNFNGQTFDRTWLESGNNRGKIINLLNGVHFDFDLGFENLDSISITDTGSNKSKLTFHYMKNNNILMPNEPLIIDPTYSDDSSTLDGHILDSSGNNICDTTPTSNSPTEVGAYVGAFDTGAGAECGRTYIEWDISSISLSAVISDVVFKFEITGAPATANTASIYPMVYLPSVGTDSQLWTDMKDGTPYVSASTLFQSTGQNLSLDLGASADSDVTGALGGSFAIGISSTNEVIDATEDRSIIAMTEDTGATPAPTLEITYTSTPKPDSIVDLTLDSSTQTTATVSFSAPNLNTGNLTTYTFNLDTPQNNNVQTFFANSTDNPFVITGLTLGTSYSANATAITEGGGNYTLANILNFTTPTFILPGAPTLSAVALGDTALRFTSIPGTAGDNSTKDFSLQCELNGAGGWLNSVNNNTYASFYEYTGLTLGDDLICQWRDGSADGWGAWSNNATDTLALAILSAQRGIADTDDKLMQFIEMVSGMGGVYFGLGVLPFGIMLIGFMAGKKTVRIFTLATLMLMGIVHASGYYVYPNWYWTLCLLFGLVLIMGRMKSD